ncbi:MAG TPA: protein-glutamate O-methyltransferase CheR [Methyloceanibacter sp.]|nr:protein-glutamate O-methyltransferase CheR [Methyloceanibacter sp.]
MMAHEFALVRRILKEHSGLNLGADKQDLIEGKLRPLLREFGLPTLSHLVLTMMRPEAFTLRARVAQAVSVQESYFFRDKEPFRYFTDVMLPALMAKREAMRRIRIWCAAAASGQEPYSLAMELAERDERLAGWTIEIVATDFVEEALEKARKGLYTQFEVQRGLPVSLLVKYFKKVGHGWEIKQDIRRRVEFRTHNLLDDSQALGMFDAIFCRNVLIYFDDATKRAVLVRLAQQLAPDGYLVLGAAETVSGSSDEFMPIADRLHGIFRFTPQAAATIEARGANGPSSGAVPRASAPP